MYNKIIAIGNLGNDPELRYTPTGRPVCSFRIATNRRWANQEGEKQEETQWFSVVAWGKLGETVNQYLTKGRLIFVEGRFQLREWEGQDGKNRATAEIVATDIKFLSRDEAAAGDSGDANVDPDFGGPDLPFG